MLASFAIVSRYIILKIILKFVEEFNAILCKPDEFCESRGRLFTPQGRWTKTVGCTYTLIGNIPGGVQVSKRWRTWTRYLTKSQGNAFTKQEFGTELLVKVGVYDHPCYTYISYWVTSTSISRHIGVLSLNYHRKQESLYAREDLSLQSSVTRYLTKQRQHGRRWYLLWARLFL